MGYVEVAGTVKAMVIMSMRVVPVCVYQVFLHHYFICDVGSNDSCFACRSLMVVPSTVLVQAASV